METFFIIIIFSFVFFLYRLLFYIFAESQPDGHLGLIKEPECRSAATSSCKNALYFSKINNT